MQYIAEISVGTPGQKIRVCLDTGSMVLEIPSINCIGCQQNTERFNESSSPTFHNLTKKMEIIYGYGHIKGFLAEDSLHFQGINVTGKFMLTTWNELYDNYDFVGILGLGNSNSYQNIFDLAFQSGALSSSTYGFKLGNKYYNEKSYFYYNISQQDMKDFTIIPLYASNGWFFEAYLYVNGEVFQKPQILLDTGTSLTYFNKDTYDKLYNTYWSHLCSPSKQFNYYQYQTTQEILKCDCNYNVHPSFEFLLEGGKKIQLTPQMYLYGNEYSTNCYLGIKSDQETMILGDNFLRHHIAIFNKRDNSIGLKRQNKPIFTDYLKSQILLSLLPTIQALLFALLALLICFSYTQNSQPIPSLNIQLTQNIQPQTQ